MNAQVAFIKTTEVNKDELEQRVKAMYQDVAEDPQGDYHFEMGREMAERLGYAPQDLDRIPAEAIDSFAGVGYYFQYADIKEGDRVLDLGSGSGMDSFVAALKAGSTGEIIGVDMTNAQRKKAISLRDRDGFDNITFENAYIEHTPVEDESIDVVISNGVINLAADKFAVFHEIARVLKPGGRLAISDIVTENPLPEGISCDATLWAACIGGAMQQDYYRAAIESAGLRVEVMQDNPEYQFISEGARWATETYKVKSISLLAVKP